MPTKIEWTDETLNPFVVEGGGYHCTKISLGCQNCFAETFNYRFGNKKPYDNAPVEFVFNIKVLDKTLSWRKPRRIFWQSMGDLFHPRITDEQREVFFRFIVANIPFAHRHTNIVLTKRPKAAKCFYEQHQYLWEHIPNLWLGVTAENQQMFDKRWAILKQIPAAVYMISYEPALGPLVLPPDFLALGKRAWLVCGGESSSKARPMHPNWARGVRDQCVTAGVSYFFKQWGEWAPKFLTRSIHYNKIAVAVFDEDGNGYKPIYLRDVKPSIRDRQVFPGVPMYKVGKKAAGRKLDGKIHSQFPPDDRR